MKKLPIGIQTFSNIVHEDYLYIDKTKEVLELIENYRYVFLSRPRRFGKSLFMDTIAEVFEGNKELFEGLYIYDKWDFDVKYPVIKISWSDTLLSIEDLKRILNDVIKKNQTRLGIVCESEDSRSCFRELIHKTHKKYNEQVVILIDEYDKPILDVIEDSQQAKINRDFIKGLYSIIKDSDKYIKFALLTGVSKFSKTSLFSGLNMLEDISLNPKFGNVCGYTQNDIETTFKPYLKDVDLDKMKLWYNGYNFLKDSVYNPFDILLFIKNDFKYKNYWFETGTPSFLIKLIEKNNYFLPKLSNLVIGEKLLDSFDIDNLDLEVILYQTGYLTIEKTVIDEYDEDDISYKLKLSNKEVAISFNEYIIYALYKDKSSTRQNIRKALMTVNLEELEIVLKSMFKQIPYSNFTNNNIEKFEGFYASIIHTYIQSLGIEVIGEDIDNQGRIDLTIKINNLIYIIEFKMGNEDALKQIKDKKYYEKYLYLKQDIYLLGINFDKRIRNISNFVWEKLD